jgi:DNA-binding transcriptional MerR regulator
MPFHRLSTAKIAKELGCHPNTVRLYEQIGFIAPVPRSPKGYRLYTPAHLDQMRLARLAMEAAYPGPNIRRSILAVIRQAAAQDYPAALDLANRHLSVVRLEREQAETAAAFLEVWAQGQPVKAQGGGLLIQQAARVLSLTVDTLRNWERNGFISVPRSPHNGYRQYHPLQIGRLRVIRLLRQSGYSAMAILRMLVQFDQGAAGDLRLALDTPRADEDVYSAADRWLSTLESEEKRAMKIIALLEEMGEKWGNPDAKTRA